MSEQTRKYVLALYSAQSAKPLSVKGILHSVPLALNEYALQRFISQMDELEEWCSWLNEKARMDAESSDASSAEGE